MLPPRTFKLDGSTHGKPADLEVTVAESPRMLRAKKGSRTFTVLEEKKALGLVYMNSGGTRLECRQCYFPKSNGKGKREARGTTKCVHVQAVRTALARAAEEMEP
jgi:hypothetical protein